MLRKIRCENIFNAPRTNRGSGLVLFWRSTIDATVEGSSTNYIDATFQEEDRAGTRVIIPLPLTVVELETLIASKALQCVVDLNLNDVSLEGDLKIVINALNEDSHSLAVYFESTC